MFSSVKSNEKYFNHFTCEINAARQSAALSHIYWEYLFCMQVKNQ